MPEDKIVTVTLGCGAVVEVEADTGSERVGRGLTIRVNDKQGFAAVFDPAEDWESTPDLQFELADAGKGLVLWMNWNALPGLKKLVDQMHRKAKREGRI